MKSITLICLFAALISAVHAAGRDLASVKEADRVEHARELLGSRYRHSHARKLENKAHLAHNILAAVEKHLPKKYRHRAKEVAQAIIVEANKHEMDPFFVMAVIAGESSFNPDARGPVGEIGLMQLRPSTGKWIAKIAKQKWAGPNTLKDPVANIRLGTAYLAWLRAKFDGQGQLYVAAYNMGPRNVHKALGKNIWPKDYPRHVRTRYLSFYKTIAVAKL